VADALSCPACVVAPVPPGQVDLATLAAAQAICTEVASWKACADARVLEINGLLLVCMCADRLI